MKKLYLSLLIFTTIIFLSACSKDIFKDYEDRIEGTWRLDDVDRIGIGTSNVTFTEGRFTFIEPGRFEYTDRFGGFYEGSWDIRKQRIRGNCDNGDCDDRNVKSLSITAVDFQTRDLKTEYFDEIKFTGTNKFNAFIYLNSRTYVFRFRRE